MRVHPVLSGLKKRVTDSEEIMAEAFTQRVSVSFDSLFSNIDYTCVQGADKNRQKDEFCLLTADSRQCCAGAVFVAIVGSAADGHEYINRAAAKGASLIVVQDDHDIVPPGLDLSIISVKNTRCVYAALAANWYSSPAKSLNLIAITGTNGKTTITYLLESVLHGFGKSVGVIGTVDYRWTDKSGALYSLEAKRTTPDALELQALMRKMVDDGVEYVVMEVSSHALDQQRIGDLKFQVGAFTNLTHDHLDYHQSLEAYWQAKSKLFADHMAPDGKAVISLPLSEDAEAGIWAEKMLLFCRRQPQAVIACGTGKGAEVHLASYVFDLNSSSLELMINGQPFRLCSPLVGKFNIENLLTTLGVTEALGLERDTVRKILTRATGAPGRLQRIKQPAGVEADLPEVFVDYAHTPDALEKVLQTLKELPHRDLYCVFGCGGDRDISKRPVMGRIAVQYADVAVATSDNPRTEDPERILEHVVDGMVQKGTVIHPCDWLLERLHGVRGSLLVANRSDAIRTAVSCAGNNDIVLIAGKGHEKYQLVGDKTYFFDDCLEAQDAMISWNSHHLQNALNKEIEGEVRVCFSGKVETDSRKLGSGDIFVALQGDKFDGHAFVSQAEAQGAALSIISDVEKIPADCTLPRIVVDDTLEALGCLAAYRKKLVKSLKDIPVVAVTGSCGKTTVKEMCACIFEQNWPASTSFPADRVLKTKGNFNNLIGLPLSLLPLSVKHDAAILEMGMNRKGEIAKLAAITAPDISCITNVHAAHLEELGDIYGVAAAKKELFDNTGEDKLLVVNIDDDMLAPCLAEYSQRHLTFGMDLKTQEADVFATDIAVGEDGAVYFTLHIKGQEARVELQVAGRHNVANGLAAAAVAHGAGIAFEKIAAGLKAFCPVDKRMKSETMASGLRVLNDCYNANPASMTAGIDALVSMRSPHTMAILGDMLELGGTAEKAHHAIGRKLAQDGVNFVALYGDFVKNVLQGAVQAGMDEACIRVFGKKAEIASWVSDLLDQGRLVKGDWLLVKGSRGMKMETVLEAMKESN